VKRLLLAVGALVPGPLPCDAAPPAVAGASEESKVTTDAQLLQHIAQVDPVHADTMSRAPAVFTTQELSFYKKYRLVKVEVRLPERPLVFWYADDGAQAVNLLKDGAQAIYRMNEKEALALNAAQVPEYLKFFVAYTEGGKRKVVERDEDISWLRTISTNQALADKKAEAVSKLKPVRVSPMNMGFEAVALVKAGKQLLELTCVVRKNGQVDVLNEQVVMENLPVPIAF
jgi:hypothetical protein